MSAFSPERLRAVRRARGVSRDELAHRIGRTHSAVVKYEHGTVSPSAQALGEIAAALCIEVGDLFTPTYSDGHGNAS